MAVELCLLVGDRTSRSLRRPGVSAVLITQAIYVVVIVTLVPDYLPVARDAWQVYGALDATGSTLLRLSEMRSWAIALLAAALLVPRWRRSGAALVLLSAATGFLLAAWVQSKGWPYQLYPYRAFVLAFGVAWALAVVDTSPAVARVTAGVRGVTVAGLVLLFVWSGRAVLEARRWQGSVVQQFIALVERQPRHESIAMLSMRNIMWPAFPAATYTGSRWVLRHNSLWFLPGLYKDDFDRGDATFHPLSRMTPLERRLFDQVVDDLCRTPPRLLVIQPPVPDLPAGGRAIDLIAYYRQDPRFVRLFSGYDESDTLLTFTIYARNRNVMCD